jgi:hypothetical protein
MKVNAELFMSGPNIIGATGGSGTRVVARIVRRGGMYIGQRLNDSEDAVDFGDYSDRWINGYIPYRSSALPTSIQSAMTEEIQVLLEKHCACMDQQGKPWGWKEPRSIYLLPFFHALMPSLKFLHVTRDGRDMAYSTNQNQLRKHGDTLLGWVDKFRTQPARSIALWTRINLLAADYGESELRDQYLHVRFEDLCSDPISNINRIFDFFKLSGDVEQIAEEEVSPPASLGRWRRESSWPKLNRIGGTALERFGYL